MTADQLWTFTAGAITMFLLVLLVRSFWSYWDGRHSGGTVRIARAELSLLHTTIENLQAEVAALHAALDRRQEEIS